MKEEVEPVTFTIAGLLFGFLVFDMGILYCVHYPDPHIRSYVYAMISTTISIFCAVLFNQAIFSFFLEQLLPAPWPRGLGIEVTYRWRLVVGLLIFTLHFTLLNVGAYKLRNLRGKGYLFALKTIGGHITAFAGITTFGSLQELGPFRTSISMSILVMCFANAVLALARWASSKTREAFNQMVHRQAQASLSQLSAADSVSDMRSPKSNRIYRQMSVVVEDDQQYLWVEDIAESEDELSALVSSFLMVQVVLFLTTDRMLPIKGVIFFHPTAMQFGQLALWASGFMVMLGLMTYVRMSFKYHRLADEIGWRHRGANTLQGFCAMSMSLSIQKLGEWFTRRNIEVNALALVANAFLMTAVSLFLIWLLDFIADRLLPPDEDAQGHASSQGAAPGVEAIFSDGSDGDIMDARRTEERKISGATRLVRSLGLETGEEELPAHRHGPRRVTLSAQLADKLAKSLRIVYHVVEGSKDYSQQEIALRRIIDAFGLLVGFCWEKAFDAADETLVEGLPSTKAHPVLARLFLCTILVIAVLPAWLWYIVPKARLDWKGHKFLMATHQPLQRQATFGSL